MNSRAYEQRRSQIEHYFDRTAADAWAKLTSNEPVGRIRATVRAGRDTMRETLLSWLPQDLTGKRVLDAGCGTGALAVQAALRGAHVVAIDLSPTLVKLAGERVASEFPNLPGSIEFLSGDMLSPELGHFDHVVCMDSLIHYDCDQIADALAALGDSNAALRLAPTYGKAHGRKGAALLAIQALELDYARCAGSNQSRCGRSFGMGQTLVTARTCAGVCHHRCRHLAKSSSQVWPRASW